MSQWTRSEKLSLLGLVVAVLSCPLLYKIPEVREVFDRPGPTKPEAPLQEESHETQRKLSRAQQDKHERHEPDRQQNEKGEGAPGAKPEGGSAAQPAPPEDGSTVQLAPPIVMTSPVNEKYAVVVGISYFKDPQIPGLQFAAKDARDMAVVLKDPRYGRFAPENVTLLTDEQATRGNILATLQQIQLRVQEADLVVVYVQSHCSSRQTESGQSREGYIVTNDTVLDSIWSDALEYESFLRQVSLLRAGRKAVFLDAPFSGPRLSKKALLVEPVGSDRRTERLFVPETGMYVITSSKATERSFESDTLKSSYFTHFLLKVLQREGEPPTMGDIFDYLSREVPAAVAQEKGQPQHPEIVPADGLLDLRIGIAPQRGG